MIKVSPTLAHCARNMQCPLECPYSKENMSQRTLGALKAENTWCNRGPRVDSRGLEQRGNKVGCFNSQWSLFVHWLIVKYLYQSSSGCNYPLHSLAHICKWKSKLLLFNFCLVSLLYIIESLPLPLCIPFCTPLELLQQVNFPSKGSIKFYHIY